MGGGHGVERAVAQGHFAVSQDGLEAVTLQHGDDLAQQPVDARPAPQLAADLPAELLPEAAGHVVDALRRRAVAGLQSPGQEVGGEVVAAVGKAQLQLAVGRPVQLGRAPGPGTLPPR